MLGEGHYGTCYKLIMNNKEYTCKRIKFSKTIQFNREANILKNLRTTTNLPEYFNSFKSKATQRTAKNPYPKESVNFRAFAKLQNKLEDSSF